MRRIGFESLLVRFGEGIQIVEGVWSRAFMCINIAISHSFSSRHEGVGSQEATQRVQGCLGDYHCIVKESDQNY